MERKIVKCPNCDHETDIRKVVRRKYCFKCGHLMKDLVI